MRQVALANGFDIVSVGLPGGRALMEVQAGTADAAIIDSLHGRRHGGRGHQLSLS